MNFLKRNLALTEGLMDADEIHRRFRASPAGRVTLFILAALILYAEIFAVSLLLEDSGFAALVIHIGCCLAAYVYTIATVRLKIGARFGIIFSIFLTILGPFAAAGMMLLLIVY